MALKQRISRLEQRIRQEDSVFSMLLAEMPQGLTPAEEQAFTEQHSVTATLRTLKEILRRIDSTSLGPPSERNKRPAA
jgi:hypothetical protein